MLTVLAVIDKPIGIAKFNHALDSLVEESLPPGDKKQYRLSMERKSELSEISPILPV